MPENEGQAETEPKIRAEPINVIVKDQSGNELHFKVRKTTKFDKVRSFGDGHQWHVSTESITQDYCLPNPLPAISYLMWWEKTAVL